MDNKRKYSRVGVPGMEADISDDIGFCSARVMDISRFGLRLDELSRKIRAKDDKFYLVVSDHAGRRFKILAQCRWEERGRFSKTIGAEITDAPWEWTEFVSAMEPEKSDGWGITEKMFH